MIIGIKNIIGKTIAGVVVKESDQYPKSQVFLIFSDNTSYELYSDSPRIKGNTEVQLVGLEGVKNYLSSSHKIIFEAHDDELME